MASCPSKRGSPESVAANAAFLKPLLSGYADASVALSVVVAGLQARMDKARVRAFAGSSLLVDAIVALSSQRKRAALLKSLQQFDKQCIFRIEELGASIRLLEVVAHLLEAHTLHSSDTSPLSPVFLLQLSELLQAQTTIGYDAMFGIAVVFLRPRRVKYCTVWHDTIDAALCEVIHDGPSETCFTRCSPNSVIVTPRTTDGVVAKYVLVEDVCAMLRCLSDDGSPAVAGSTTVSLDALGRVHVSFSVYSADVATVYLCVDICDVRACELELVAFQPLSGVPVRKLAIPNLAGAAFGGRPYAMAFSSDMQHLMVSMYSEHLLSVFCVEEDDTLTRLHVIGGEGAGQLQFQYPSTLCLSPIGTVLVAERGNGRIQEVTAPGEVAPAFVRIIALQNSPMCFALHKDIIAVAGGNGFTGNPIELLSYASGLHLASFPTSPHLREPPAGLCFTPDGLRIVVAVTMTYSRGGARAGFPYTPPWDGVHRVAIYCVADGGFLEYVGEGTGSTIVRGGSSTLCLPDACGIIISDNNTGGDVCLYSSNGTTLIWRFNGVPVGKGSSSSLAICNGKLCVLSSGCVHVLQ